MYGEAETTSLYGFYHLGLEVYLSRGYWTPWIFVPCGYNNRSKDVRKMTQFIVTLKDNQRQCFPTKPARNISVHTAATITSTSSTREDAVSSVESVWRHDQSLKLLIQLALSPTFLPIFFPAAVSSPQFRAIPPPHIRSSASYRFWRLIMHLSASGSDSMIPFSTGCGRRRRSVDPYVLNVYATATTIL